MSLKFGGTFFNLFQMGMVLPWSILPMEVRFRHELDLRLRLKIEAVHGLLWPPEVRWELITLALPFWLALGRFSWDEKVDRKGCCCCRLLLSKDMDLCRHLQQ